MVRDHHRELHEFDKYTTKHHTSYPLFIKSEDRYIDKTTVFTAMKSVLNRNQHHLHCKSKKRKRKKERTLIANC